MSALRERVERAIASREVNHSHDVYLPTFYDEYIHLEPVSGNFILLNMYDYISYVYIVITLAKRLIP